jgi:hypothetical protein
VTVPSEEAIVGYRPETQRAIVYWWHFVPQMDGSFVADEVRTMELTRPSAEGGATCSTAPARH